MGETKFKSHREELRARQNAEMLDRAEGLTAEQVGARWGLTKDAASHRLRKLGFVVDRSTKPGVWRKAGP